LAAGLGWLAHSQFHWQREDVWAGYQGEARDNDFLAAQRLLERTGHPAACLNGLPARMPTPGDVLILPRRTQAMAAADAGRITGWVAQGGLLLAEAAPEEGAGPDPLFRTLGVRVEPGPPAPGPVPLNGAELVLDLGAGRLRADFPSGPRLAVRDLGRGRALLCASLDCLGNDAIQRLDHADFLCAVAAQRPAGRVWIVTRDLPRSAWGWLRDRAWPILAALGALCLFSIWAAAPRFGPLLADPDPARRGFLEHLDACGRYQWRTNQGRPLLEASRAAFRLRLAQVRPAWPALDPGELCLRLAQHSGLPRDQIDRALHAPGTAHAAAFLEAIRTLHNLRKTL
jgi:hypothetical protein